MTRRWLPLLVVALLVAGPAAARAAEPTLVVRIGSIDGLIADGQFLADLAGRGEQATQVQKLLQVKIGPKGLDGIDTKRPLGLYGTLSAENPVDSRAVALVPVADETAFLDLLERLNLKATKDSDGVYTLQRPVVPVPIYFRFANKYAYITARDRGAIDKAELLDPAKILPPGGIGVASATIRLDQVPDNLKQLALSRLELTLADAQDRERPGETPTERRLRVQMTKEIGKQLTTVIREGKEVGLRLDLDKSGEQLVIELSLDGKPGSGLADRIADYGKGQSLLSGALGGDSAVNGLIYYSLPEGLRQTWDEAVDAGIREVLDKESDPAKKAQEEKLLNALVPTLKAGVIDGGLSVRGPNANKLYTVVGGVRLKAGLALEKVLREAVPLLPPGDQAKIKLNVETAGNIKIHQLAVTDMDKKGRRLFGEAPTAYVALRDDAAFFALGEEGLTAIKEALTAQPKAGPQVQMEVSLNRLAPALARDNPKAATAAQAAFGSGGKDRVQVQVVGGSALKVRLVVQTPVVKFVSQVLQPAQGGE